MSAWNRGWIALLGVATVVELLHVRRPECTLSAATRALCRTDTRAGRMVFLAGWGALSTWFSLHILGGTNGLPPGSS